MVGRSLRDHAQASDHQIIAPTSSELDLTDRTAVFAALAEVKPDLVLHSAGRVGGI